MSESFRFIHFVSTKPIAKKTKISILGSTGKLGSLILEEISKNDNYIFNKSIDRNMDLSFISNNM